MTVTANAPQGWATKRLKFVATYNDEVLSENTDEDREIDYVEISGVSLNEGIREINRMTFGQAPSRARRIVRSGDVLVSTVRTYLKSIATVDEASDDLIASTGFCVVRPQASIESKFVGWVAKSEPFVNEVVARSVGVSYPAINASQLVDIRIPLPPIDTQRRIAEYLDDKTAKIDALIEKKRALLDRLAEKRQALITQAVTKGLNPDAKMKPSRIDWLGEVPEHWKVLQLRRITRKVSTGRTPPTVGTDYFGGDICWFTPGDFGDSIQLEQSSRSLVLDAFEEGVSTLFPEGTIYLVGIGATLGKVAVGTCPGSANQQINAIQLDTNHDPYFFAYFLHGFRNEVRNASNGNTLGILNQDGTKSLWVTCPPEQEQASIASMLIKNESDQSSAISKINNSIRMLQEYRSSTITAAVTGQIADLK